MKYKTTTTTPAWNKQQQFGINNNNQGCRLVEAAEARARMMTGVSHSVVSQGFLNGQSASSLLPLPQHFVPSFCFLCMPIQQQLRP